MRRSMVTVALREPHAGRDVPPRVGIRGRARVRYFVTAYEALLGATFTRTLPWVPALRAPVRGAAGPLRRDVTHRRHLSRTVGGRRKSLEFLRSDSDQPNPTRAWRLVYHLRARRSRRRRGTRVGSASRSPRPRRQQLHARGDQSAVCPLG